jgi:hypothetical protein
MHLGIRYLGFIHRQLHLYRLDVESCFIIFFFQNIYISIDVKSPAALKCLPAHIFIVSQLHPTSILYLYPSYYTHLSHMLRHHCILCSPQPWHPWLSLPLSHVHMATLTYLHFTARQSLTPHPHSYTLLHCTIPSVL